MGGIARWRAGASCNFDAGSRTRSVLFTRRFTDRLQRHCGRQHRRLRHTNRGRRSQTFNLPSGSRSRARLDAGRAQCRIRFSANERAATGLLAFMEHFDQWRSAGALADATRVQCRVFFRRQETRLRRDYDGVYSTLVPASSTNWTGSWSAISRSAMASRQRRRSRGSMVQRS